jgi:hypothetical protein
MKNTAQIDAKYLITLVLIGTNGSSIYDWLEDLYQKKNQKTKSIYSHIEYIRQSLDFVFSLSPKSQIRAL